MSTDTGGPMLYPNIDGGWTAPDRSAEAEARAAELRREVERLSSRCYLLAGLAVVGWAIVAGLLLSS